MGTEIVVGDTLPDTPANEALREKLREAAARLRSKAAHPSNWKASE